ncbi:hypothetical protein [Sphingobium phenoxybenzoativorans]|uniref:hypothetical protein n=1 Tax=Sphingobium phenoxybenzoativorans TaxID=1592790 RepID=UPI0008724F53|nr:hypothetical protein [Sphingobium phenoxybenzoativorans]
MTIWQEAYRGYQISYQARDSVVRIARPGENEPLDVIEYAAPGEGRSILRIKAKALIDLDRARLR